jgi:SAM-dependent methyltransferase
VFGTFVPVPDEPTTSAPLPGQLGISEGLRQFVEQYPFQRRPILNFVVEVARATTPGAAVLDLGAGDAPYRELFAHVRYRTSDWSQSLHAGAVTVDVVGSAEALPVDDGTFDLVLCTEVLEHVPDPGAVLAECFRMLAPGGRVAITVPLMWELHELPYDYYRYTPAGLKHLLTAAGFVELQIRTSGDGFSTIAQLMRNLGWTMGDADDGLTADRIQARAMLNELSDSIAALAPLDARRIMPLGHSALGQRPR